MAGDGPGWTDACSHIVVICPKEGLEKIAVYIPTDGNPGFRASRFLYTPNLRSETIINKISRQNRISPKLPQHASGYSFPVLPLGFSETAPLISFPHPI